MGEATSEDLARIRNAVLFRDRCVKAAREHYRRVGLRPVDTYARAAFDAMERLIRADERERLAETARRVLDERGDDGEHG
jgi:hypothetical protein